MAIGTKAIIWMRLSVEIQEKAQKIEVKESLFLIGTSNKLLASLLFMVIHKIYQRVLTRLVIKIRTRAISI